jgi:hypothetical protein
METDFEVTDTARTVTIVTQQANHPWWVIAAEIARVLSSYGSGPLRGYSVGVFTPRFGLGALGNPWSLPTENLTWELPTPTASAWLAMKGTGPFKAPHTNLRAIANYPHRDCVLFALSKATGISSLDELVERRTLCDSPRDERVTTSWIWFRSSSMKCSSKYGGAWRCPGLGRPGTFAGKTTQGISAHDFGSSRGGVQ